MKESKRSLCEKCGKGKVDLFYAMIAVGLDFAELCVCDVTPEFVESATNGPALVCKKCSKRMPDRRPSGSTHWVFRHAFCGCANPERYQIDPNMVEELVQKLVDQKAKLKEKPAKDDREIQVEKRKFPLDSFKPLKQIDGPNGRVFKCRDRQLGTLVAVKVLKPQPEQLSQLQQEAEIASELEHENILKVLDFGTTRGLYPFMVTEYADGVTLKTLIEKQGHLPISEAINIINQVCSGLNHAHRREVFHWNLTSSKILLKNSTKGNPVVKIFDFGIALNTVTDGGFEAESDSDDSEPGSTILGTPGYMSPDLAMGQEYDARSEIYSIGCVLFEMLTGELPFKGKTPEAVLAQQTEKAVPRLKDANRRAFPNGFPAELEKIVNRCLQKNKEDRYASVDQLKRAIKTFSSHVTPETVPEPVWQTAFQEHKLLICGVLVCLLAGAGWATYSWLPTESAFNMLGKSGLQTENFLATTGSDYAKVQLGRRYLEGDGVQQDKFKAVALFTEASQSGSVPAEFWLGYCYLRGFVHKYQGESYANAVTTIAEATERDIENNKQAYALILKAAEKGYPMAERYMGLLIRAGMEPTGKIEPPSSKGRTKRLTDSSSWLRKAAEHGDTEAINFWGITQAEEFGWSPLSYVGAFDYSAKWISEKEEVFKLFQKAAQAGQPDAQFNLGLCHELGVGTPASNELAKKWYLASAEAGVADAQFRYGFLLELEKNPDAVKWYKKAAEQNHLLAEIALCRVYSEGFCIPANRIQAQAWYVKVLENPDRFYNKDLSPESTNTANTQEKVIAGLKNICREHLEMPHLVVQKWGPSGIKCWPRGPMRDIDLIQITPIKNVTYLDLFGMSIHDAGAKYLPGLPLTMLRLAGQELTTSGYANIAKLSSLQGIELSGEQKTEGLSKLADCRNLVFVGVTGLITQETIDELAAIKTLKNIAFHCREDVSLASWGALPNLESLRLDEATQTTINSVAAIKSVKLVTISSFKQESPSEQMNLAPLLHLPKLERLRINTNFNEHIVNQLKAFKHLKNLSLTSTKGATDADLNLLRQIPAKSIEVFLDADCKITDKGLMILGSIRNVTHVNISVAPVTPGGVKAFKAKFPSHSVSYSENGKQVKDKQKDQVEDQVEKQLKQQIKEQEEKQRQEQEKLKKGQPTKPAKGEEGEAEEE